MSFFSLFSDKKEINSRVLIERIDLLESDVKTLKREVQNLDIALSLAKKRKYIAKEDEQVEEKKEDKYQGQFLPE